MNSKQKAYLTFLGIGLFAAALALSSCQSKGPQKNPAVVPEEDKEVGLLDLTSGAEEKKREETVENVRDVRKKGRRQGLQRTITEPLPKKKR